MRRMRWLTGIMLSILTCIMASPLLCQLPIPEQTDLSYTFFAGAAFPISGHTQTKSMPDIGLTWYGPAESIFGDNACFGLSVEWIPFQNDEGDTINIVPFFINYKQYGVIGNWRLSVNFGAGILATTDGIPELNLNSGSNFGWTGGVGVDISNNITLEAKFIGGNDPSNDGMAAVQLGYRF